MSEEISKIEDDGVLDVPEGLDNTEIKINPDYYIHSAIIKAQNCLVKENTKEGFLQFIVMVQHLEILAKSAKRINYEKFEEALKLFKETEEYKKASDDIVKDVKLANKKIEIIMTEVFSQKTITTPMKA